MDFKDYIKHNQLQTVILIIVIILIYLLYKCHFYNIDQRIWYIPKIKKNKEVMLFEANAIMNSNDLFQIHLPGLSPPSIFKNNKDKKDAYIKAKKFYKNQYGLSDSYLNLFMHEVFVNRDADYGVVYMQSKTGNKKIKMKDGGFVVYVPKGKKLYGQYGGKYGVASDRPGSLAFGYYITNDNLINYFGLCPLVNFTTYDGTYTPIDCDVKIIKANNKKLIGLKGKAQGIYIDRKLKNGKNHVIIKNMLTFT